MDRAAYIWDLRFARRPGQTIRLLGCVALLLLRYRIRNETSFRLRHRVTDSRLVWAAAARTSQL
ncbi:MAG: hypothetical protein QOJ51_6556 [Acidobacteriaceae bacterium]|nr:hypothetical protein [Acidobacteriaceae bacterium]